MTELNNLILADFFLGRAESNPDFQILTFECPEVPDDETRTFGELWINSQKLSAALVARGVTPGDNFGVMLRNHPEFIEAMASASTLGAAFIPLDPRTKGAKLAYTLNNSESKGIICADYCIQQVMDIRDQVPDLEWIIMLENTSEADACLASDFPDCTSMSEIMDAGETTVDREPIDPSQAIEIMYTSGTTGDPKGVPIANARLAGAPCQDQDSSLSRKTGPIPDYH